MKNLSYYFCVLDIETSTLYQENDDGEEEPKAVWLSYGYIKLYDLNFNTIKKWYFREWEELKIAFYELHQRFYKYKLICYVHNLAYEFDFLIKNISKPFQILSNSTHNIISGILEDFKFIEFRCSYQLSGYSLRKIGEMINYPKLESDYRTIYPHDIVTEEEKIYCERDCDIVAKYITEVMLKEYGKLFNIPFTKTGRVRKVFNDFYSQYCDKPEWDLMPDENCYNAMVDSFMGGIVISNPLFTDTILNNVHSYDESSAYPYVMLKEQYPYTIRKAEEFNLKSLKEYKFWIAKIKFINISSKFNWQWLSISKLNSFDDSCRFYNGKLMYGKEIVKTLTNIDFENIEMTYSFDNIEVLEFYPLEKYDYLPTPYIKTIEKYSQLKYELKIKLSQLDENSDYYQEVYRDYMLAKGDFNSIYGMTVQKLTNPEYIIDDNYHWIEKDIQYKKINGKHIKRNFLFGIYITAYARRNLLRGIVHNCKDTLVYSDTDSIKFIGLNIFINTNEKLQYPFSENIALKNLGTFEYECTYKEFKTFGAKKYCYNIDNVYHLVVAGLPKNKYEFNNINDFYCGRLFKNCKLGKKYIYNNFSYDLNEDDNIINMQELFVQDLIDNDVETNGGVALYPTSYLLDMTEADKFIIITFKKGLLLWLKNYTQQNGIDLTEFCNTHLPTI